MVADPVVIRRYPLVSPLVKDSRKEGRGCSIPVPFDAGVYRGAPASNALLFSCGTQAYATRMLTATPDVTKHLILL